MLEQRLKAARKVKKLTQEQLANLLQTTKGTISNYENGYSTPSNEMLALLAEKLEVTSDYLLGRTNNPNPLTKEEKDIAKRVAQLRHDLQHSEGLAFDGEPMSEEARESLLEAMEFGVRLAKKNNKKFIPKKYRNNEE